MELELKHIAPYLPYCLRAIDEFGRIRTLTIEHSTYDTNTVGLFRLFDFDKDGKYCNKPILRPLSELTCTTYLDGETITFEELISTDENAFGVNGFGEPVFYVNNKWEKIDVKDLPFETVSGLFRYHFDVFNLIPQGLAVDSTTLK